MMMMMLMIMKKTKEELIEGRKERRMGGEVGNI